MGYRLRAISLFLIYNYLCGWGMNYLTPGNSTTRELSLVPLGPGDLIDRAVRFYRRNFWTFFFIAAPPLITGTVISVGWTFLARSLFSVSESANAINLGLYYMFVW